VLLLEIKTISVRIPKLFSICAKTHIPATANEIFKPLNERREEKRGHEEKKAVKSDTI
jgi:hypothetical protein